MGTISEKCTSQPGGASSPGRIIEALKALAVRVQCYKIILDCAEHNVAFYKKCGFTRKEVQMVTYLGVPSKL